MTVLSDLLNIVSLTSHVLFKYSNGERASPAQTINYSFLADRLSFLIGVTLDDLFNNWLSSAVVKRMYMYSGY